MTITLYDSNKKAKIPGIDREFWNRNKLLSVIHLEILKRSNLLFSTFWNRFIAVLQYNLNSW